MKEQESLDQFDQLLLVVVGRHKKIQIFSQFALFSSLPTSGDPSNQHLVSLRPTTLAVAPNPSPSWKPENSRNNDVMEVVNKF